MMTTKTEAFAHFGARLTNPRWSWSAKADAGVVLTLWADKFVCTVTPVSYDGSHEPGDQTAPGNKERLRHLIWARDCCAGRIMVVLARRAPTTGGRRKIASIEPRPDLLMRLTDLDERTGAFRAELADGSDARSA